MEDTLQRAYAYAVAHREELAGAVAQHLLLVAVALGIGLVLCVPLGIWTSRSRVAQAVVNVFTTLRVIPSLAVLFLAIPYFGLSFTSAAMTLTLLALPPVLINTDTAFRHISAAIREAAVGMGMTRRQVFRRVEVPLALPVVLAGVKTATVELIASATLAAFIGAGGLGIYVVRGFALYDISILLVGAIPVALLALLAEGSMTALQKALLPPV